MSVTDVSRRVGPVDGNDVTTVFNFTFKVFATTDILVVLTDALGIDTVQVLTTNYTVALNTDQNVAPGGAVTMLIPPATGEKFTLTSEVPDTQPLVLRNQSSYNPATQENAFDRAVMVSQQQELVQALTLKIPLSDGAGTNSVILPTAVNRATKALIFDEFGNITVSEGAYDDAAASAAAAAASAAAALVSENNAAADAILTAADRVATGEDAVSAAASAASAATYAVDMVRTLFVGKHGSDSYTGISQGQAKLTFGAALALASTLAPTKISPVIIRCDDAGVYTENVTGESWVEVHAPGATLIGNHTLADNVHWLFDEMNATSGTMVTKSTGTGEAILETTSVELTGVANGIVCTSGIIHYRTYSFELEDGDAIGSTSNSEIYLQFDAIEISGTGTAVNLAAAGTVILRGGDIENVGSGTGTAFVMSAAGTIDAQLNRIKTTTAYNISAGTLNLIVNSIVSGAQAESGTGFANLTGAGSDLITVPRIVGTPARGLSNLLKTSGSAGTTSTSETALISDAGGGSIDVAAGDGYIRTANLHTATLLSFDWAASAGVAIPTDTTRYVGIVYNAGAPILDVRTLNDWNNHDEFPLGLVTNEGGTLHIFNNPATVADSVNHIASRFYGTNPLERDERNGGLIIGDPGGTNEMSLTEGSLWDRTNNFPITAKNTGATSTFDYYVGATQDAADAGAWDPSNYNLAGVKTSLPGSKYANVWWYIEADDELVALYGMGSYNSSTAAEAEAPPSILPDRIVTHGRLLGRFVFLSGAAAPTTIQTVFGTTFSAAGVTDHNSLANLTVGDVHTQYALVDGTRAFTGTVGGVTPTAAAHLTRKDYVDSADNLRVLLAGKAGGQVIVGGTDAGEDLNLESTSNATKGDVIIQPNGGNTGIGITPSYLLDMQSKFTQTAALRVRALDHAGSSPYIIFGRADMALAGSIGSRADGQIAFGATSNHGIHLITNDTERVTIDSAGNVDILGGSLDVSGGIDAGSNGTFLKTKVIDIGDWDMVTTSSVTVAHSVASAIANIRSVSATIINDAFSAVFDLTGAYGPTDAAPSIGGGVQWGATNITLNRINVGLFATTAFDATSFNRGRITITYEE